MSTRAFEERKAVASLPVSVKPGAPHELAFASCRYCGRWSVAGPVDQVKAQAETHVLACPATRLKESKR